MRKRIRPKHSTAGFTLLEVLVVVIIIGVLAAIAAPGWNAFLNRQRVTTAREQVLQVIRQAQDEAKRTNSDRVVVFDPNSGSPRVTFLSYQKGTAVPDATSLSSANWQLLGNGNVRSGILQLKTKGTYSAIVFDGHGAVATKPDVPADQFTSLDGNSSNTGFAVTISQAGTSGSGSNRCIIIQTLLGATRLAEGSNCPS